MTGIGENAYTPVMYQDLANPFMGPMSYPYGIGMGFGAGIPQTNYLGGTQMRTQASADEFLAQRKYQDKKDLSLLKKVGLFFAGCVALGCIPPLRKGIKNAGGIKNYLKNGWDTFKNWIKN